MNCNNCGNEIADNSAFCPECGTKVIAESKAPVVTVVEEHKVESITETTEVHSPQDEVAEVTYAEKEVSAPWYEQPAPTPAPWYEQSAPAPVPAYAPSPSPAYAQVKPELSVKSDAKPVGKLLYILMMLVNAIPVVGLIVHIICMAAAKNKSFKNYCGAVVILWVVGLLLSIIAGVLLYFVFKDFFAELIESFNDGTLVIGIKPIS